VATSGHDAASTARSRNNERMTDYLEVSTATASKEEAVEIARIAVTSRLAAGAQIIGPVTSVFWHLGEFGSGEEWRLVLRTHVDRFEQLRAAIVENHPWQNPEVTAVSIAAGSDEYLDWIRETVPNES
jgi:periplasmic divalent cation tolerance protein